MNVSLLLIILLFGAFATYLAGDKLASKVALFFSLTALGCSVVLLNHFNAGENISMIAQWISKPNILPLNRPFWCEIHVKSKS